VERELGKLKNKQFLEEVIEEYFDDMSFTEKEKTDISEATVRDLVLLEKGDIVSD